MITATIDGTEYPNVSTITVGGKSIALTGGGDDLATLPNQVRLSAVCNPTGVSVTIYWLWLDTAYASGIKIRRKKGSAPTDMSDGELVCTINNTSTTSYTDTDFDEEDPNEVGTMQSPVMWYYRAFPINSSIQGQTYIQAATNTGVIAVGVYYVDNATTLSALSVEDKFAFGRWRDTPLVWDVADITNGRFKSILHSSQVPQLPFDAPEKENGGNPITDRYNYGRNVWSMSNLRQWLHATGAAGAWFSPQNDYDSLASNYSSLEGFLYGFTAQERNLILPETHVCILPNADGGGTETVVDTVWLPSEVEMGDTGSSYAAEGTTMQMFSGDLNTDAQRAKNWGIIYWLRTARASGAHSERYVQAAGGFSNYNAHYACAVRAGLTLPSSTVIVWDSTLNMYVVQAPNAE